MGYIFSILLRISNYIASIFLSLSDKLRKFCGGNVLEEIPPSQDAESFSNTYKLLFELVSSIQMSGDPSVVFDEFENSRTLKNISTEVGNFFVEATSNSVIEEIPEDDEELLDDYGVDFSSISLNVFSSDCKLVPINEDRFKVEGFLFGITCTMDYVTSVLSMRVFRGDTFLNSESIVSILSELYRTSCKENIEERKLVNDIVMGLGRS